MILVCGRNGQLGRALSQALSPLDSLVLWGREEADFGKVGWEEKLRELNPESIRAVVNAAAFTKVDLAEKEENLADRINRRAPAILADYARSAGALFVHFSTDYVYDGEKEGFYTEKDAPNPLSVYGKSKLAGDRAVMETKGLKHIIFRTSWVYGLTGKNFPHAILRLSQREGELSMDSSQIGAPTSAEFLAVVVSLILRDHLLGKPVPNGLYHLTNSGETTWLAFARHLVNKAKILGFPLKLEPEDIKAREGEDLSRPARRPRNSRLSTKKFQDDFGLRPPHFLYHTELFLENLKLLMEQLR
jgi:dTDP-4-dehydrorhamnose reductase